MYTPYDSRWEESNHQDILFQHLMQLQRMVRNFSVGSSLSRDAMYSMCHEF